MAEERAAGEAAAADDDTACRDRVRAVCGGLWGSARCAHAAVQVQRWIWSGGSLVVSVFIFLVVRARSLARSQNLSIDEMMRFVRKSHMGRRKPGSRFASGEQVSCASTETLYCAFKEKDLIKTRIIGWSLACTN